VARALNQLLEQKREAIAALCARFNVERLDVFGSVLRADFDSEQSDIDLLVQFKPISGYARVDAYFHLRDELRALLGKEIDLVMTGAIKNRYISQEIERTKQLVYAA
jgi:predicted nucleotidyltransferase